MIFRTGSVLIVGKCDEPTLINIYHFIKNMLITEYTNICQHNQTNDKTAETKVKSKKILSARLPLGSGNQFAAILVPTGFHLSLFYFSLFL
jgi:hypothetical protein